MSFFQNHSSWPLVELKNIATLKRGYDLPTKLRVEGEVPIYAANGRNGTHNEVKIKGPGVITGRSGTIGKVHYTEDDYWPLNTALYVTNFHGNDPRWVYYMLSAFKLERFVEGAGVPTLNRNLVHDELIPLPPLDEQKRIAAILDKADAIRQKRKQAIALADEFLRSVFLEMFGDPVTNPKGWEVKCLGELTTKPISYGILKPEEHDSNGVPMLRIQDIKHNSIQCENLHLVSNKLSQQYKRTILLGGELVISLVGTIGLVAKIPETLKGANVHRNLGVIDVKNKNLSEYLLVLMQMKEFKVILEKVTKGGVHKLLNLSDLKEVALPIPSDAELVRFKDVFMKEMRIKEFQNTQLLNEDIIFNSLSQKAFSGQL
ncbi:restriction endonuclease subunit S [Vibrio vulnificus]|uniref:restriction endonuclease subunit S n=1 Tax=Vibrio vulnificus TaxID=672 RepID=UPI004059236D